MSTQSEGTESDSTVSKLETVGQLSRAEPFTAHKLFVEVAQEARGKRGEVECALAKTSASLIKHPAEPAAVRAPVSELRFLLRHGTPRGRLAAASNIESVIDDIDTGRIQCLGRLVPALSKTIVEEHDQELIISSGVSLAVIVGNVGAPSCSDAIVELLRGFLSNEMAHEVGVRAEPHIQFEQPNGITAETGQTDNRN